MFTSLRHRITRAIAGGLNSNTQWIRYTARGFRPRGAIGLGIEDCVLVRLMN